MKANLRALLLFPFGAMLLVGLIPYREFVSFTYIFEEVDLYRATALYLVGAILLYLLLRQFLPRTGSTEVAMALLAAAALVPYQPLLAGLVLAILLVARLIDRARSTAIATAVTNAVALAVVVPAAMQAHAFVGAVFPPAAAEVEIPRASGFEPSALAETPSILHVVLDGYGDSDILAELYGHNNEAFETALESRGFTVFEEAVSPYNQTLLVMPSIMQGDYAGPFDQGDLGDRTARRMLGAAVGGGPVIDAFREAGHTIGFVSSDYPLVDFEDATRLSPPLPWKGVLETHVLRFWPGLVRSYHRELLEAAFDPGNAHRLEPPFFLYQHILAPHPPFSVAADGSTRASLTRGLSDGSHFVRGQEDRRTAYKAGYVEKLNYVNAQLLNQIDALPETPMIVILHGDHGPGAYFDHEEAERSCLAERMRPFLAVRSDLPGLQARLSAATAAPFNLVNLYRLIWDEIGTEPVSLLESRVSFARWSDISDLTPVSPRELGSCDGRLP
ncbi:MAG: hypothetical protein AAGE80_11150 [Pseudomonadota bacterium]